MLPGEPVTTKEERRSEPGAREWVSRQFTRVEDIVYVGLGILLAVSAAVLLVVSAISFTKNLMGGSFPAGTVNLLDQLLLILMIVELLYTVQVSYREHTLIPEPFLIVGLIAATRRILVLTAEFADVADKPEPVFRNAMIELGLLTVLVLVMVVSLALLRGRRSGAVAERG